MTTPLTAKELYHKGFNDGLDAAAAQLLKTADDYDSEITRLLGLQRRNDTEKKQTNALQEQSQLVRLHARRILELKLP